jgi:hypothetical protein
MLAGLVVWNVSQQRSASELLSQSTALQKQIETAKNKKSSASAAQANTRKLREKLTMDGQPMDWKNLGARMIEIQKNDQSGDDAVLDSFQLRLSKMSKEELISALDEIETLGLEEDARLLLEETLVEELIEKDPAYTLQKYADRIQDDSDGVGWQLPSALGAWAKKDMKAAAAWFDGEIAAARFESKSLDGQSEARLEFEAAILTELLSSDMAAANARITALPVNQRATAMQQISVSEMSLAGQRGYVEMIRELVPDGERLDSFNHVISELFPEGDYTKTGSFLDTVKATPAERAAAAKDTGNSRLEEISSERPVTRNDIEEFRAWIKQQAPQTLDQATGEALGEAVQEDGDFNFEKASKLALEYHQSSGKDEVLIGFLENFSSHENLDQAIKLAGQIKDVKRREQILANLQ